MANIGSTAGSLVENDDDETHEMRFRKNKVVFQSQAGKTGQEETAKEWESKFKKQLELSQSDAAVIE